MSIPELTGDQIWLVALSFALLVLAYVVSELRNATKSRLRPRILRELRFGEPIKVKHATPRSLTHDGKQRYGAEKHDFECFQLLWYFPEWINKLYSDLSEPIRLQELRDTSISGSRADEGPAYGRRYDIYYNRCKIGLLEICASLDRVFDPAVKSVDVEITINAVPPTVLPYSDVYGFLSTVASLVTSRSKPKYAHLPNGETEYDDALSSIRTAMAELMWNTRSEADAWTELSIRLSGTPDHYYELLQHRMKRDMQGAQAPSQAPIVPQP